MSVEVQRTAPDECSTNLSGAAPSISYQQIADYYNLQGWQVRLTSSSS